LFFDTLRLNEKKLKAGTMTLEAITNQKAIPGLIREPVANYDLFEEQEITT
jgi:ribosomal protein L5